jgi:hypothetical protein
LANVAHWINSEETCLDIKDIGTDDEELFEEEEREGGLGITQAAHANIEVAAAHLGGGNGGVSEGETTVEAAAMADS